MVVDSIDALSERYGIPAPRIINTLQKDLAENSGTNIVYTLEKSGKTELDYLGDGVIQCLSEDRDGRRVLDGWSSRSFAVNPSNSGNIILL